VLLCQKTTKDGSSRNALYHGQTVHIYRENGEIQIVSGFDKKLSGENVLEGFELDLSPLKM